MLIFDDNGIYCKQANIYIDPWKPVARAIVTHAHADHARPGMGSYLAHPLCAPILRLRLGQDISCQTLEYGEEIHINGVKISLHPAGHIPGSAQVRLEYKGEVWVVSGDYKLAEDGISTRFEPVTCHTFITESTFGIPIYRFPQPLQIHKAINEWWAANRADGYNSIICAYALGKAQRVLAHLDASVGPIYTHGAVDNINALLSTSVKLPPTRRIDKEVNRKEIKGALIVAPPSATDGPWIRSMSPYRLGICSGWMQLRGTRRRCGADMGFVLSDHADWNQLNTAVQATGAQKVYVTHGYKAAYSRWLTETYGLQATEADTLYTGESIDNQQITATDETI